MTIFKPVIDHEIELEYQLEEQRIKSSNKLRIVILAIWSILTSAFVIKNYVETRYVDSLIGIISITLLVIIINNDLNSSYLETKILSLQSRLRDMSLKIDKLLKNKEKN